MSNVNKKQVRNHFNAVSSFYERKKRQVYLNLVKGGVGCIPIGRIVDLGCGTGLALSWFDGEKVGADFSCELLRQGGHDADYVVADIEATPFRDSIFDVALCLDVAEHLPSLKVIDEAYRILSPAGVLHFSTADRMFGFIIDVLTKLRLKLPEGPHQWRKTDEIKQKIRLAGFTCRDQLKPPIRFYTATKSNESQPHLPT